jgi:hypothetical protein
MPRLGPNVETVDAAGRIEAVTKFDVKQCRAALKLPGLQATVRQAIERRLKKLTTWPCGHKKAHPDDELCRRCSPS